MGLIIHHFTNGGILVDDDFDTASNWDGNETANQAKGIHTDDDGNKDDDWRQAKAFSLNTRTDDVVFDLLINDIEEEEAKGGPWRINEKQDWVNDTGDDRAKHWNEVEEEGDEAERDGDTAWNIENKAKDEDYGGGDDAIK